MAASTLRNRLDRLDRLAPPAADPATPPPDAPLLAAIDQARERHTARRAAIAADREQLRRYVAARADRRRRLFAALGTSRVPTVPTVAIPDADGDAGAFLAAVGAYAAARVADAGLRRVAERTAGLAGSSAGLHWTPDPVRDARDERARLVRDVAACVGRVEAERLVAIAYGEHREDG